MMYHGHVQGVGFRFTVMRMAGQYNSLAGYVRNCPDGAVEVVVEGEKEDVQNFLKDIVANTPGNIRKIDAQDIPVSGRYTRFDVTY